MEVKLALLQMSVVGGRKELNLSKAGSMIREASMHGAAVALLPEAMNLGWMDASAQTEADEIPDGFSCRELAEAARHHGMFVCAGLVERDRDRIYNSALLIDPGGQIIAHHRKINELAIAHSLYALGDRLHVARTELCDFGLMICADAFATGQVISRTLGYMGAGIILSPCAWAVPADHDNAKDPYGKLWLDNYGPVARDFRLWIAGVSNVGLIRCGPWTGHKCIGNSMVVGPTGQAVLTGPYGQDAETILYIDIAPGPRPAQGDEWARL